MEDAPRHYLIDMDEFDVKWDQGNLERVTRWWWKLSPITVNGKNLPLSLGLHPPSKGFSCKISPEQESKNSKLGWPLMRARMAL